MTARGLWPRLCHVVTSLGSESQRGGGRQEEHCSLGRQGLGPKLPVQLTSIRPGQNGCSRRNTFLRASSICRRPCRLTRSFKTGRANIPTPTCRRFVVGQCYLAASTPRSCLSSLVAFLSGDRGCLDLCTSRVNCAERIYRLSSHVSAPSFRETHCASCSASEFYLIT